MLYVTEILHMFHILSLTNTLTKRIERKKSKWGIGILSHITGFYITHTNHFNLYFTFIFLANTHNLHDIQKLYMDARCPLLSHGNACADWRTACIFDFVNREKRLFNNSNRMNCSINKSYRSHLIFFNISYHNLRHIYNVTTCRQYMVA